MNHPFSPYRGYRDLFAAEQARRDASSKERSRLCFSYALPPHVAIRLGSRARRSMTRALGRTHLKLSLECPARIFFENGVELRLVPAPAGLEATAFYLAHPWCREDASKAEPLFRGVLPWQDILSPSVSRHAQMAWLARLTTTPSSLRNAHLVDMTCGDALLLQTPYTLLGVFRKERRGLCLAAWPQTQENPEGNPAHILPRRSMEKVSEQIAQAALRADTQFSRLPAHKRIVLGMACEYGLLFLGLQDAFAWISEQLHQFMKRKPS